jgi:hypothetical protein
LTRETTFSFELRRGFFDVADGEIISFRCHGAMAWPTYVVSFLEPDLAISLKPAWVCVAQAVEQDDIAEIKWHMERRLADAKQAVAEADTPAHRGPARLPPSRRAWYFSWRRGQLQERHDFSSRALSNALIE